MKKNEKAKNTVKIKNKVYFRKEITCPDGRRKNLYAKSRAELNAKVAAFRASIANAGNVNAVPTVAEYATKQLMLMEKTVRPATYAGYASKVRLYLATPPLGNMPIDQVREDDVRNALLQVADQSASSYSTVHMLLRTIFAAAKRNHLITDDPTEALSGRGGKAPKGRPALTDVQVKTLLTAVGGLPVETYIRIGLEAGLRREEILGLQWDCVHLDSNAPYISVQRAWRIEHNRPVVSESLKTDTSRRDVVIPQSLADYLTAEKAAATSAYVVCNKQGNPLSGTQWRQLWKQVTNRMVQPHTYTRYAKGKKVVHTVIPALGATASRNPRVTYSIDFNLTPHQLRHTYATNLIGAGVDPKTVQYLLGHSNSKMTMDIYAKTKYHRPEDLADTINTAFGCNSQGSGEDENES